MLNWKVLKEFIKLAYKLYSKKVFAVNDEMKDAKRIMEHIIKNQITNSY